jgi:hypothetical protein
MAIVWHKTLQLIRNENKKCADKIQTYGDGSNPLAEMTVKKVKSGTIEHAIR